MGIKDIAMDDEKFFKAFDKAFDNLGKAFDKLYVIPLTKVILFIWRKCYYLYVDIKWAIFSFIPTYFRILKRSIKSGGGIADGLILEAGLTYKQAKRIAFSSQESALDSLCEPTNSIDIPDGGYSVFEISLLTLYEIRSNKDYSEDVHRYCDKQLKVFNKVINEDEDKEEIYTIAEHKRLNVLIDKYMNSFDRFKVSKKYSGIWY
jgi:hypothetical protein